MTFTAGVKVQVLVLPCARQWREFCVDVYSILERFVLGERLLGAPLLILPHILCLTEDVR